MAMRPPSIHMATTTTKRQKTIAQKSRHPIQPHPQSVSAGDSQSPWGVPRGGHEGAQGGDASFLFLSCRVCVCVFVRPSDILYVGIGRGTLFFFHFFFFFYRLIIVFDFCFDLFSIHDAE